MPESPFMGDLPNERFKIGEKPLETLEWITLDHTLYTKIEKQDQLKF